MSKTIDELVQKVQFLNENLRAKQDRLSGLNINFNTLSEMDDECEKLKALGVQADALRAQLKEVTAASNQLIDNIKGNFQDIKKTIKTNFEPENWIKYGVQDKR